MDKKTVGSRIRGLRKCKNISQSELASILGVGQNSIARYEQNERTPSFGVLLKLSDYFDVSTDYLLGKSNIRDDSKNLFKSFYSELPSFIERCISEHPNEQKSAIYKLAYSHMSCLTRLDWADQLNMLFVLVQIQRTIENLTHEFNKLAYEIIEVEYNYPDNLDRTVNKDVSIDNFSNFNKRYIEQRAHIESLLNKLFQHSFTIKLEDTFIFTDELHKYVAKKPFKKNDTFYSDVDELDEIMENMGK